MPQPKGQLLGLALCTLACGAQTDGEPLRFLQVSAGYESTCGVIEDGRVRCWGRRASPGGESDFVEVANAFSHACARRTNGALSCWDDPEDGQTTPPVGAVFRTVSAGWKRTCGVLEDGTAACFGAVSSGPSSTDGSATTIEQPTAAQFSMVSAGGTHSCGVLLDGELACWGWFPFGGAEPPAGPFSQVAVSQASTSAFTCALGLDQNVICWGEPDYGGDGSDDGGDGPVIAALPVPEGRFRAIAAGASHACGVRDDAEVICWGGSAANRLPPPPAGPFASVSAGFYHACGLRPDGEAVCWGEDASGQLKIPTD